MNQAERNHLLTACAFARVFLQDADAELRGATNEQRVKSQRSLAAALQNLKEARHEPDVQ